MKWDTRVQPNEIGVAVKDGVVTVTGWVDSFSWSAPGVAEVENRIMIQARALPGLSGFGGWRRSGYGDVAAAMREAARPTERARNARSHTPSTIASASSEMPG